MNNAIGYFVAGCLFQAAVTYLITRLVVGKVRHQVEIEIKHKVDLEMRVQPSADEDGEEWKRG